MGLGKTIQMICLLLHERAEKWAEKPTLLICPTSVAGNWKKEIEKFSRNRKSAPDSIIVILQYFREIQFPIFQMSRELFVVC